MTALTADAQVAIILGPSPGVYGSGSYGSSLTYGYPGVAADAAAGTALASASVATTAAVTAALTPLASTLKGAFTTQDTLQWVGWATGSVEVVSGRLQVACASAYPTLSSAAVYELTGSSVTVEVVQTSGVGTSTDTTLYLDYTSSGGIRLSGDALIQFIVEDTTLYLRYNTGSGYNDVTLPYSPANHRWWRISESGGTVTWATSPDGQTWTTLRTATPGMPTASMYVHLQAGYWGSEASPRPALFDNLNLPPIAASASLTTSLALTANAVRAASVDSQVAFTAGPTARYGSAIFGASTLGTPGVTASASNRTAGASIPLTAAVSASASDGTSQDANAPFSAGVIAAAALTAAADAAMPSTASVAAAGRRTVTADAIAAESAAVTAAATTQNVALAAATLTFDAAVTDGAVVASQATAAVATSIAVTGASARTATASAAVPVAATVVATASNARVANASIPVTVAVSCATGGSGSPLATISAVELIGDVGALQLVIPAPPVDEGTPGIQATIVNPALEVAPGSLIVKVANGVPGATVTLSVTEPLSGRLALPMGGPLGDPQPPTTVVLDDSGAAGGVNVPVSVSSTGSKTLTVTDGDTTVSPAFTVFSLATPGSFVVPTYSPPAAVQNATGVKKWVFQDTASGDVYHFPYNPNQMTSPFGTKNISWTATTAIDGQKLAFEGQQAPVQWQFQGFIRSKAEYDAFVYWQNKRNRIWITDHFGRAWLGYVTQFDVVARRAANLPWSHDYTMHVLIFDGPVTPA